MEVGHNGAAGSIAKVAAQAPSASPPATSADPAAAQSPATGPTLAPAALHDGVDALQAIPPAADGLLRSASAPAALQKPAKKAAVAAAQHAYNWTPDRAALPRLLLQRRAVESPRSESLSDESPRSEAPHSGDETPVLADLRRSPTETFLQSRGTQTPPGWTPEETLKLPLEQVVQLEKEHLHTHVPLYHACQAEAYVMHALYRSVLKRLTDEAPVTPGFWIRQPLARAPHRAFGDIRDYMSYVEQTGVGRLSRDNGGMRQWHLLSCNPSLLQNCDQDAMESTADYFFDGTSVAAPAWHEPWNDFCSDLPVSPMQRSELADVLPEALESFAAIKQPQGLLLQLLVPHALVNRVCYISGKNGDVLAHANPIETLLGLQQADYRHAVADADTLQCRVSTALLLAPDTAEQVKVVPHTNIRPDALNAWESAMDAQIKAIFG